MASSLTYLLLELGWLKNSSTRTQPEGLLVVTPAWRPQGSQTSYMVAQGSKDENSVWSFRT